jgi:uncharacterized membrane protein YphA (DoxX/SURF4 family)
MFPTGTAGAALLLLRISVATTLVVDGTGHWALMNSFWMLPAFLLPALFLCIGFLTPYASILCCLIQLAVLLLTGGENGFHLAISILNSGIVGLLGPGAYSIDAYLFGRRILNVPPRR